MHGAQTNGTPCTRSRRLEHIATHLTVTVFVMFVLSCLIASMRVPGRHGQLRIQEGRHCDVGLGNGNALAWLAGVAAFRIERKRVASWTHGTGRGSRARHERRHAAPSFSVCFLPDRARGLTDGQFPMDRRHRPIPDRVFTLHSYPRL